MTYNLSIFLGIFRWMTTKAQEMFTKWTGGNFRPKSIHIVRQSWHTLDTKIRNHLLIADFSSAAWAAFHKAITLTLPIYFSGCHTFIYCSLWYYISSKTEFPFINTFLRSQNYINQFNVLQFCGKHRTSSNWNNPWKYVLNLPDAGYETFPVGRWNCEIYNY